MRVIQVTDDDCCDLIDQLELARYKPPCPLAENQILEDVHRHFHYVVVSWLQKHGAKTLR